MPTEDARIERAKQQQDYDHSTPRCATCVFCRTEPKQPYLERTTTSRKGKQKTQLVKHRAHPVRNPLVDRCTFGNFIVSRNGVCNEWRSREGERIVE